MTTAERERTKDYLWLMLPPGSRDPRRLDWIIDAIETGRFGPPPKAGT